MDRLSHLTEDVPWRFYENHPQSLSPLLLMFASFYFGYRVICIRLMVCNQIISHQHRWQNQLSGWPNSIRCTFFSPHWFACTESERKGYLFSWAVLGMGSTASMSSSFKVNWNFCHYKQSYVREIHVYFNKYLVSLFLTVILCVSEL